MPAAAVPAATAAVPTAAAAAKVPTRCKAHGRRDANTSAVIMWAWRSDARSKQRSDARRQRHRRSAQNKTRTAPLPTLAPPTRPAKAPKAARKARERPATRGISTVCDDATAVKSGMARRC